MTATIKTLESLYAIDRKARYAWGEIRHGDTAKGQRALRRLRLAARRMMTNSATVSIDVDSPVVIMHAGRVIGVVTMSRPEIDGLEAIPEICGHPIQYGDPSFLSAVRAPRASLSAAGTTKVPVDATPLEIAAIAFVQEWAG